MERYISGKPVCNAKDILKDGQDYILIIDEGCFSQLVEIRAKAPVAVLSDYSLAFSHIPSYLQMFSIPLFFIPESRNRTYTTYYEETHSIADNIRTKAIISLEDMRGLDSIVIDTLYNIVYSMDINKLPSINTEAIGSIENFKVRMSVKSKNEVAFTAFDADGIGTIFTEFLFFDDFEYPSYGVQRDVLESIFVKNQSAGYTVRLFDINHDKVPKWLQGVKLGNYNHPLFEKFFRQYLDEQLRCLCDLSRKYPISILVPYVKNLGDIKYIRKCIDECASPNRNRVKVGSMVETVDMIKEMQNIASEVDFFSVGANDLVHSFFEMGRVNSFTQDQMARVLSDNRFWTLLADVRQLAGETPIRMGGQLPIYPEALKRLVELGYNQFTVSPQWVRQIKYQLINPII